MAKERIKKYILDLGVDDVGFAKVEDYHSPKSYAVENFLPGANTIISLVYQELDTCESPSVTIAMNGRLDMNYFQRSCTKSIASLKGSFGQRQWIYPMPPLWNCIRTDRRWRTFLTATRQWPPEWEHSDGTTWSSIPALEPGSV